MSENVTVQVPVKRYVKRFLEAKYGSPALLISKDPIGKQFYSLVGSPSIGRDKRYNLKQYPEFITIALTQRVFFQKGYILTPTNIIAFNRIVEDHIDSALEFFVCGAVMVGKARKVDAYKEFMERTKLTWDDFPFETLKKKIDRSSLFKNTRLSA